MSRQLITRLSLLNSLTRSILKRCISTRDKEFKRFDALDFDEASIVFIFPHLLKPQNHNTRKEVFSSKELSVREFLAKWTLVLLMEKQRFWIETKGVEFLYDVQERKFQEVFMKGKWKESIKIIYLAECFQLRFKRIFLA